MSGFKMDESFFLTKNNYEDSIKNLLKSLLKDGDFTDITLALSDDGDKKIAGHKAILGGSSSFFRNIFRQTQNTASSLVLQLRGVNSKNMNSIMEFIYLGQTSVNKEDLPTFLESAERLQIEGLMQSGKASMSGKLGIEQHWSQSLPEQENTIGAKSVSVEESCRENYTNSSMNQSTFDTSTVSSILDTSVSSINVSNSSDMAFKFTPEFSSTLLLSKKDQEEAAKLVASIKNKSELKQEITIGEENSEDSCSENYTDSSMNQSTLMSSLSSSIMDPKDQEEAAKMVANIKSKSKLEQNTIILNGLVTFNADTKTYSCSKCLLSSVHRRSALRHFATAHAESNIKQERVTEDISPKRDSDSSFESSLEMKPEESGSKHECGHCDFTTKHRSSLKRHLYGVHSQEEFKPIAKENSNTGPKKYSCSSCSFATDHFFSLRRHSQTRHGVIIPLTRNTAQEQISI